MLQTLGPLIARPLLLIVSSCIRIPRCRSSFPSNQSLSPSRQCIKSTRKQMQMPCKQLFMMARTPRETESLPYAVSPKRSRPAPDRENSQQNQACKPPIREKHFLAKRLQSAKVRNDSFISSAFRRADVARRPPSLAFCTRALRACGQAR